MASDVFASIVLSDMDRTNESSYGFRSWMLQACKHPYEVVLNLFNDKADHYWTLTKGKAANCGVSIRSHKPPLHFNISATNNLGIHFSCGKYVIIANSDIVYPSYFLETVLNECEQRQLHYVRTTRVNLDRNSTAALRSPHEYSLKNSFDEVDDRFARVDPVAIPSPWIASRSALCAIGGFDPSVRCCEDMDITDRLLHYLRRTDSQSCDFVIHSLRGYHIYHEVSELYSFRDQALAIIEARARELRLLPDSTADTVSPGLSSLEAIMKDIYSEPEKIGPSSRKDSARTLGLKVLGRRNLTRLYDIRRMFRS